MNARVIIVQDTVTELRLYGRSCRHAPRTMLGMQRTRLRLRPGARTMRVVPRTRLAASGALPAHGEPLRQDVGQARDGEACCGWTRAPDTR
jgi:hypothetical protein